MAIWVSLPAWPTWMVAAPTAARISKRERDVLVDRVGDRGPGRGELVGVLVGVGAPGVGQPELAPAAVLDGLDQALVLELLERRIDRAALGFQSPPLRRSISWMTW